MSTLVVVLVAIIVPLLLLFFKKKNNRLNELSRDIPGPPRLPILGNGLPFVKNAEGILRYLCEWQDKCGTVTKYWLGSALYTFITDPDDIEVILKDTKNIKKSATYNFLQPWLGNGLVTSTAQHWHVHRKILTPAFHFNILEKFVDIFNEKGKTLIKLLKEEADKDSFNIFPFVNLYAFDAILETSMGTQCNFQEEKNSPYVKAIHRITTIVHSRSFNPLLRSKLIFSLTKLGKEQNQVLDVIHSYCKKVIQQKKKEILRAKNMSADEDELGKKKRHAFLDLLLIGQLKGSGFTDQDILDEVNTFLFAGHDTISAAMGFALYYLANNPDIQDKAYQEIDDLFGSDTQDLTLKDLQNVQYVDMVIKEVLRIAPSVPFYSRVLETDLKLKNYTLPAGCNVDVFAYKLHRNPEIYPNPEVFDPERFSVENSHKRHPYAYVPFSAGPRNCIGQKYALLELKAFLVKVLSNFRILPGENIKDIHVFVVLKASNGINVKLETRKKTK